MTQPSDSLLIDVHTHVGVDLSIYLRGHFPYGLDWPSLVEQGTQAGIGKFVVFPMVTHLGLNLAESREGRFGHKGGDDLGRRRR